MGERERERERGRKEGVKLWHLSSDEEEGGKIVTSTVRGSGDGGVSLSLFLYIHPKVVPNLKSLGGGGQGERRIQKKSFVHCNNNKLNMGTKGKLTVVVLILSLLLSLFLSLFHSLPFSLILILSQVLLQP